MGVNGGIITEAKARTSTVSAIVYNADGTVKQNLGAIAYYNKNPFKHYPVNLWIWVKRKLFG